MQLLCGDYTEYSKLRMMLIQVKHSNLNLN